MSIFLNKVASLRPAILLIQSIVVGCGVEWEIVRCDRPPLLECFVLFIYYKNFNNLLNFFNETITLFLKQLETNFWYQRIFQCHKRK